MTLDTKYQQILQGFESLSYDYAEKTFIGSFETTVKEIKQLPEYTMLSARKYKTPQGYTSYDDVALTLAGYCFALRKLPSFLKRNDISTEKTVWPLSQYFAQYHPPVFWLQKDLLLAILETDISEHIEQIQQVAPFGTIMLPLGVIKSPNHEDINHLCFAHIKSGETLPKLKIPGTDRTVQLKFSDFSDQNQDTITITTACTSGGAIYVRNTTPQRIIARAREAWTPTGLLINPKTLNRDAEQAFLDRLEKVLLQCLLIMQVRPELLDPPPKPDRSRASRGSGNTKKQPDPQLLNPIWIGRHYRSPQTTSTTSNGTGTHASPRMHWRRGYWRNQAIGPRNEKQYKLRWIEPTLVNAVLQPE